jgi:mRNA-degrading endonuclease YafQ of YafQ-DinJ toxin-antitoxin module
VDALVSRLTQAQKSAQADKGLKDEPIKGGQRRMRVTRDWRVHYTYLPDSVIRFVSLGSHDVGLKL